MTPGRERGLTALACAAGAGLALLAAGQTWASVRAEDAITPFAQALTGADLGGAAGALGWAALAGLAAQFATRGRARVAVGALIALFGAGIGYASAAAVQRSNVLAAAGGKSPMLTLGPAPAVDLNLWWTVSVAGGILLVAAGLVTAVRGPRWPGLSARYERPAPGGAAAGKAAPETAPGTGEGAAEQDASAIWKSLDRGEDPTARTNGRP